MDTGKTTFALFFGNRGFFPGSLMAQAREELPRVDPDLSEEVAERHPCAARRKLSGSRSSRRHGAVASA